MKFNIIFVDFFLNYDEVAQVPGLKSAVPNNKGGNLDLSVEMEKKPGFFS